MGATCNGVVTPRETVYDFHNDADPDHSMIAALRTPCLSQCWHLPELLFGISAWLCLTSGHQCCPHKPRLRGTVIARALKSYPTPTLLSAVLLADTHTPALYTVQQPREQSHQTFEGHRCSCVQAGLALSVSPCSVISVQQQACTTGCGICVEGQIFGVVIVPLLPAPGAFPEMPSASSLLQATPLPLLCLQPYAVVRTGMPLLAMPKLPALKLHHKLDSNDL